MALTSMKPSAPFGATDNFYLEAFCQQEAFAAVDAENTRRGFDTAWPRQRDGTPSCTSSDSCTSGLDSSRRLPQASGHTFNCEPASLSQQKGSRFGAADCHLRFVRPWCREEVRVGRAAPVRKYVAASYCSMWEKTQALLCDRRHIYEIIRESTPCNIYFDLEFATEENRGVNANAITDCLLNIVAGLAKAAWGVSVEPTNVLEMDSYNPKKFSRHIVIKLPNAALVSGPALGSFVKDGVLKHKASHMLQIRSGGMLLPIIDTSVYSRNRCFRCLFSSKAPARSSCPTSAGTMFRLSGRYPPGVCMQPFPCQWLNSLVSNTPYCPNLVQFTAQELNRVSSLLEARVLPPVTKMNPLPVEAFPAHQQKRPSYINVIDVEGIKAVERNVQVKWVFEAQASPELTKLLQQSASYMMDMAKQLCGRNVWIRKVCVLGSRGLVAFDLDGPGGHYCSWEKRCHRKNFTILKVDFWHGTFAHQCWDPVCKSKYQKLWNAHAYELPVALQQFRHLFQAPDEFDTCLENELVSTDGQKHPTCSNAQGLSLATQESSDLSRHENRVTHKATDVHIGTGTLSAAASSTTSGSTVTCAHVG